MSTTHYRSDECPARHIVGTIHTSINREDTPPRSILVGLPEMVDAKQMPNLFTTRINRQLIVFVSPVPHKLWTWTPSLSMGGTGCLCLSAKNARAVLRMALLPPGVSFKMPNQLSSPDLLHLGDSSLLPLPDWDQLLHPLPKQHHLNLRLFQLQVCIISKQLRKRWFSTASS